MMIRDSGLLFWPPCICYILSCLVMSFWDH